MSAEIKVQFEVRDMLIMKDTLKRLGYDYKEMGEHRVEIASHYRPIAIDSNSGEISFDNVDQKKVDKIRQEYMVDFYRDKALREGCQFKQEVNAQGEVIINIIRP